MLNIKEFIDKARENLAGKNVRRLAMIHAGVTVAAGLLITLLQYVLAEGMGNTSGLSGLGTRSILETGQTLLQWANMILLPFWNLGFLYVALQWARGNEAAEKDLLTGFSRIGPCLGLMLNRAIMALCITILAVNLSSTIYMMLPSSEWIRELSLGFTSTDAIYEYLYSLDAAQIMDMFWNMLPMVAIAAALELILLVPLLYRFRLAEFAILHYPGVRGLAAMVISASLLRRRRWQLFKLDLRLWWYYGLQALCVLLLYADLLLGAVGIAMPAGELSFLIPYLLYLAGLFLVQMLFRPQVDTAYALFYEKVTELGPVQKKQPIADPKDLPWDEE